MASHIRLAIRLSYARLKRRFRGIAEITVQGCDHLGALADGAADALDRAGADVAHGVDAGHGGFQRRDEPALVQLGLRAGDDEAATIERDTAAVEPAGGGIGADEQEEVADL